MAQTYFPFDSGAGANVTEAQWSKMAQNWIGTGVIKSYNNELSVYADSTGMQAKVKTGAAWLKGHYFEVDTAEEVLAIGVADGTNPRIDRIIIRLDWSLNIIQLAVLQGTPAASPTAPTLTQNTSRWEISLAQVRVNAGVTTIASGNVTDERNFVKNANGVQPGWTDLVLQNGWVNYGSGFANAGFRVNEFNELEFRGRIKNGTTTTGVIIATLPSSITLLGVNNSVPVVCHNGSGIVLGQLDINADRTITAPAVTNTYVVLDGIKGIPISY